MRSGYNVRHVRYYPERIMEKTTKFKIPPDFKEALFLKELTANRYLVKVDVNASTTEVYYDTFDWRLLNKSLVFIQNRREFILRSLTDDSVLFRIQMEKAPVFIQDFPDGRLKEYLEPLLEMRALLKLFKNSKQVKTLRVMNADQKTVARLHVSGCRLLGADNKKTLWKQVSLEPLRGYEGDFKSISDFLIEKGFSRSQDTILQEAQKILDRTPGDYSTKIKIHLEPGMRSDEATKIVLRFLLNIIRENEEGVGKDIDTEFLHDFRVAIRRTRSALSQVKGVFSPEITARFRKDFSYLGKMSNRLRDLDVYLLNEVQYRKMLPENLREAIHPIFQHLQTERRKELRKVVRGINSENYRQILDDWEVFLSSTSENMPSAEHAVIPIIQLAQERIYKRYRSIIKSGHKIEEDSPDQMLHRLRIECKKLRYLMEFFIGLFPEDEISLLIKQLKKLQDNLGRFQDLSVQTKTLKSFVEEYGIEHRNSRETILAIGALIGMLNVEKKEVRQAFSQTFAGFASARNRALFKTLFDARAKKDSSGNTGE